MSPDDLSLDSVFDVLQKKYPEPGLISHHRHVLLPATPSPDDHPHFMSSEQLNDLFIKCPALKLDGEAGPSCLGATCWKCLCNSFASLSEISAILLLSY